MSITSVPRSPKPGLHARNRHRQGYDFSRLIACVPALAPFVRPSPAGTPTIDFADPAAVKMLNRALLQADYGVSGWDIPPDYLCPPIPGRADVLHAVADLLAGDQGGEIPRGSAVRVLDIGVGANLIYPLLGHAEYGWHFVGVDIDEAALANGRRIIAANAGLDGAIELRRQASPEDVLTGVLRRGERFDLTLCNPPFHASAAEAQAATRRKLKNLGQPEKSPGKPPRLNFGGRSQELWCPGGERAFVTRLVEQSVTIGKRCRWFTTLVSKAENLPRVEAALRQAGAAAWRLLPMAQGQKQSRLVAWHF